MNPGRSFSIAGGKLPLLTAAIAPSTLVAFTTISHSPVADAFAAVVAITIVLPPLLMNVRRPRDQMLIAAAAIIPLAIVLLTMRVTAGQWIGCIAIIACYALLISACTACHNSMLVTVAFLLWLSWPIWLSGHLVGHETLVNSIAAIHPLLALNGQLLDHAIWTERPLMYGWTALNQDVPFAIPVSIIPCVVLQCGFAVILLFTAWWARRVAGSLARADR